MQGLFQVVRALTLEIFQVLFDKVEAHNTQLEILRKPAEQRRFVPVFELEPLEHLDVPSRSSLLNFLRRLALQRVILQIVVTTFDDTLTRHFRVAS